MSHAIPVGARVRITGLVKQPQLNGEHGRVVGYDDERQRYMVQLDARPMHLFTTKALKEANLERITPAPIPAPLPHHEFSSTSSAVREAAMDKLLQNVKRCIESTEEQIGLAVQQFEPFRAPARACARTRLRPRVLFIWLHHVMFHLRHSGK